MSTSAGWDGVPDGIIDNNISLVIYGDRIFDVLVRYIIAFSEIYGMFYVIWRRYDPEGTQYVRFDQLSNFLDVLQPPFQVPKPNKYEIISMKIPICRGDLMYCVDILDALTDDFAYQHGHPVGWNYDMPVRPDVVGYEPVSCTLWRQREEYCARKIQNAWRKHKLHKDTPYATGEEPDVDQNNAGTSRCKYVFGRFQS